MLADILPTGYEVGVLNGQVRPGDVVAVVGAGPIGLAAIMGAHLYSPAHIVAIDKATTGSKQRSGSVPTSSSTTTAEDPAAVIAELTDGLGADVAIEAVGIPDTFELARRARAARRLRRQHRRPRRTGDAAPGGPVDQGRDDHDGLVDTYSTPPCSSWSPPIRWTPPRS